MKFTHKEMQDIWEAVSMAAEHADEDEETAGSWDELLKKVEAMAKVDEPKPPARLPLETDEAYERRTAGLKQFTVWSEGYAATGDSNTAHRIGTVYATSFLEACAMLHRSKGGDAQLGHFTQDPPAFWGCRLYDNEADARRSFG